MSTITDAEVLARLDAIRRALREHKRDLALDDVVRLTDLLEHRAELQRRADRPAPLPVGEAVDSGPHHCHWPGCPKHVVPWLWGCSEHWWALPYTLRRLLADTYRPGQEADKAPSATYLLSATLARCWALGREDKGLDGEVQALLDAWVKA